MAAPSLDTSAAEITERATSCVGIFICICYNVEVHLEGSGPIDILKCTNLVLLCHKFCHLDRTCTTEFLLDEFVESELSL